jgi:ectoine hydroxylase-related dioxygenase (phytanoyl-CoA dioxygenase family)
MLGPPWEKNETWNSITVRQIYRSIEIKVSKVQTITALLRRVLGLLLLELRCRWLRPRMMTETPPETAAEQKAFFDERGFAVVRGCLSPSEVEECAAAVRELHERAANGEPGSFQFEPFAKDRVTADDLPVLRKIEGTGDLSPVFHRLAEHPNIIRTWQNVIGDDDLLLFRSTLMLKPAQHGSAHALHQDAAYWPLRPAGAAVAVSVALCDADSSNGCFRVIPSSHKWGLKYWGDISRQPGEDIITPMKPTDEATKRLAGIDDGGIDGGDPASAPTAEMLAGQIEVPLRAGDALFFHSLTGAFACPSVPTYTTYTHASLPACHLHSCSVS